MPDFPVDDELDQKGGAHYLQVGKMVEGGCLLRGL